MPMFPLRNKIKIKGKMSPKKFSRDFVLYHIQPITLRVFIFFLINRFRIDTPTIPQIVRKVDYKSRH